MLDPVMENALHPQQGLRGNAYFSARRCPKGEPAFIPAKAQQVIFSKSIW